MTFSIYGAAIDNLVLIRHLDTKPRWRGYSAVLFSMYTKLPSCYEILVRRFVRRVVDADTTPARV